MAPNVWQVSCILLPRRYHGKGGQNTSGDGDVSHNDADRHTSEAWSKCWDISIGQFVLLTYRQFLFWNFRPRLARLYLYKHVYLYIYICVCVESNDIYINISNLTPSITCKKESLKNTLVYTCLYDIFRVNCIHISAFWDFSYRQLLRSALSCCWGFGMIVEHSVAQNTEKHRTILSTSVTKSSFSTS